MKTFTLYTKENESNYSFIDYPNNASYGRLIYHNGDGIESTLTGGIQSINSNGFTIYIPANILTDNHVLIVRIELSTDNVIFQQSVIGKINISKPEPGSDLLVELREKLESEQTVGLAASALTALEDVSLNTATLSALEDVSLNTATLSALEAVKSNIQVGDVDASLTNPVPVSTSSEREYTHVVATATAVGDTTIYTPTSGKAVRVHFVHVDPDPSAITTPISKIKLGSSEIYRCFNLDIRQRKTGAVNAALIINLSITGSVTATAIIEEI